MGEKFIPSSDNEFASRAEMFANAIHRDPSRFAIEREDADALMAVVKSFLVAHRDAYQDGSRSPIKTMTKNKTRAQAEKMVRLIANRIRANDRIDAQTKAAVFLRERTTHPRQRTCPQEPPRLKFVRALHEGVASTPLHELSFAALEYGKSKPAGAVRLELFVDLISPDEPVPKYPGANHGGRPWYLRSFTRSPIKLIPPMTRLPMRVVYWGRWADSTGNVGPFSATAVAWIEGGSHHLLAPELGNSPKRPALLEAANDARDPILRVVVLEAQMQSYQPEVEVSLPALEQREQKQLEAPREAA